jgi:transposase
MNHKPVVSIDVAKGKCVAAAFLSYNECVRKPFPFKHDPAELTTILELLELLQQTTGIQSHVVLEATGIYSKPLVSFFPDRGYPVVVLNPLYTHQLKKRAVRKIKTDPIDAIRIVHAFYLGEGAVHLPQHEKTMELRVLCRQYYQWSDLFGDLHTHFRTVLDLLFPGHDMVFHKIHNAASLELLSNFPTPQDVLAADRTGLTYFGFSNKTAEVKLGTNRKSIICSQLLEKAYLTPMRKALTESLCKVISP